VLGIALSSSSAVEQVVSLRSSCRGHQRLARLSGECRIRTGLSLNLISGWAAGRQIKFVVVVVVVVVVLGGGGGVLQPARVLL
jgi:hypothetical protein